MALNVIAAGPGRLSSATSLTFVSTIKSAFVKSPSPSSLRTTTIRLAFSSLRRRGFHGGRIVAMASSSPPGSVNKPEDEWRAILSPEQFRILRQKGTEYPGTGEYNKLFEDGIYCCAGCGTPLYKSTTKFNSGCGWPAFFDGLPGAITRTMGVELRLHVQLVEDISVMFLKEKVSLHLRMSDTV
ncbi:PREDICTED: peptide methionine sulfoxide reductase B2, chloroplastic isoform X2 [Camelina sativa]|uniref:Peptide methionine sulfoxide reductase B2, chloroplastic isoform X2 n=1 Tax=Camelina sativa TaxID=90675 RepID=A0ABM0UD50_CAMSA|nr:PREDICTED: peptide methionine sulfoxide reductase B2, chloroplastic isoform X2 [Camelina sativa]